MVFDTAKQSPGVYVLEQDSAAPIAGVGTSTAGFIGFIGAVSKSDPPPTIAETTQTVGTADEPVLISNDGSATKKEFKLPKSSAGEGDVITDAGFGFTVGGNPATEFELVNRGKESFITFTTPPGRNAEIKGFFKVRVPASVPAATTTQPQIPLGNAGMSTVVASQTVPVTTDLAKPGEVKLCTNFTEFKKFFGDFSNHPGQSNLAHAVFGFFRNGGTRCYVVGVSSESETDVKAALGQFEAIDEIAIVAAPGMINVRGAVVEHCSSMQDRVAILDSPATVDLSATNIDAVVKPPNSQSDYAALYFPWLLVFDPASTDPKNPNKAVPPSGHIAGIYARVDSQRGVYKAPANEVVMGAVGLAQPISKRNQDGLNPIGINCIRDFNGTIRVWGARTLNVDSQFRYISTRRLFNYLRESIDEGTQWTVFEPNSPELWARIRRNVTAFLTVVWRSGALFGNTPEEAFYVKCDAENNPPELRDLGQVNIDIGVAVVKPAEFVIFKLRQWSGPGGN